MIAEKEDTSFEFVEEFDVNLKINKESLSPRRNVAYYCKEMEINRSLVSTALSAFIASGESVFNPPRCLDGIGASGVSGLLWKKYFGDDVDVLINDSNEASFQIISGNIKTNNLKISVSKKDPCVILHEMPFSFISLDCHTEASLYLDSVFRNIPKKGIFALTTKDDCSLYGRSPEIALRNYGGTITKTFYSKELAVRLILAGMVRSAARYSKGLHVLCVLSIKSYITILVKILKGPAQANTSVEKVRRLVHCNMCEDRSFYPSSIYPLESPSKLLSCGCAAQTPGKVVLELGPVWCGSLFDANFIFNMSIQLKKLPWENQLKDVLKILLTEAWCPQIKDEKVLATLLPPKISTVATNKITQEKNEEDLDAPPPKKLKEDTSSAIECKMSQLTPEPPFYFNLHKHSPKGPYLAKLEQVVASLRSAGFRASRTHFDSVAVRTDATLLDLQKLVQKHP